MTQVLGLMVPLTVDVQAQEYLSFLVEQVWNLFLLSFPMFDQAWTKYALHTTSFFFSPF